MKSYLIKACLDRIQSNARTGNYLYNSFPIEKGLKQRDTISPVLPSFALEYASRKVQETNLELDLNDTQQILAYADCVNLIGRYQSNRKKCRCH